MNLASVQIKQLRLRGDTRAKTALLASLDSQTWPGADDPRIIFIKRLQVKSPWWMFARELAQQSEVEYRNAVTALQANAATNAIVFASEAHLVAQILVNLARNQSPWYQQTWLAQTQLAAEPMAVLLHRPVLVPEVLEQLQRQQLLADFFTRCTQTDVQKLLSGLQGFLAVALPVYSLASNAATVSAKPSAGNPQKTLPLAQLRWAEKWLPLLLTQAQNTNAQQPLLQLIACLGLWRFSPQQLRAPAAWSLWLTELANKAYTMDLLLAVDNPTSQITVSKTSAQSSVLTAKNSAQFDAYTTTANHGLPPVVATNQRMDKTSLPSSQTPGDIVNEREAEAKSTTVDYRYIQQAGFLYFINWLRDFDGISNLLAPFSPWLWLALLQRDCCRVWQLPLDESLQALLLEIGGLSETDLHESTDEVVVTSLYSAREFLQHRLRDFHLEPADWLVIPARAQCEQAYVQIYVHESAVRLDLRLAGLDLNPGWVPWLGRVIYFHFGQYPDILREHC